jgi:hypothetical protein
MAVSYAQAAQGSGPVDVIQAAKNPLRIPRAVSILKVCRGTVM